MLSCSAARPSAATAWWRCSWVDVRCDCERLRHQLKSPSTTPCAESTWLQSLQRDRWHRTKCAASKWSTKNRTTSTAHPSVCKCLPKRLLTREATALVRSGIEAAALVAVTGGCASPPPLPPPPRSPPPRPSPLLMPRPREPRGRTAESETARCTHASSSEVGLRAYSERRRCPAASRLNPSKVWAAASPPE